MLATEYLGAYLGAGKEFRSLGKIHYPYCLQEETKAQRGQVSHLIDCSKPTQLDSQPLLLRLLQAKVASSANH